MENVVPHTSKCYANALALRNPFSWLSWYPQVGEILQRLSAETEVPTELLMEFGRWVLEADQQEEDREGNQQELVCGTLSGPRTPLSFSSLLRKTDELFPFRPLSWPSLPLPK